MRKKTYTNGEWNFMPDYQGRSAETLIENPRWESRKLRVPSSWRFILDPEADFQPFDMFGYPRAWNDAQSGVLGRSFLVDARPGERVFLILEGVLQKTAIFVNQTNLLETQEGFLPLEIDISEYVANGSENDLKVWCGPFDSVEIETERKDLAPNGSWFGKLARGIWQDVYLEYRPALFIDDIFIRTSTRRQEIQVEVCVHNSATPQSGAVRLSIYAGDRLVKELLSRTVDFAGGKTIPLTLSDIWTDAMLWSPEHPHLYTLQAEILMDGESVDSVETRFGFREVWIDGPNFFLNGVRLNLRIDAWHYQGFVQQTKQCALNWYQACKETGINCVRPHAMPYPEFYYDAADEVGMLIIGESAIYGSSKSNLADHPEFIENCAAHLKALVKRDRNHPSIIIWSMQNEMRWVDGREGYKTAMKGLTQAMKALDPTRPVSYDGDNRLVDPENLEIVSMHYNIDGTVQSWQKDKPLIFGEHGKWHYVCPQDCVDLGGPEAHYSFDRCQQAIGENEHLFIEYARREDVSGVCPFNMSYYMGRTLPPQDVPLAWDDLSTPGVKPDVIKAHSLTINNGAVDGPLFRPDPSWQPVHEAFKPVTVIANEYDAVFFGDIELDRSFSIYNDTERPAAARFVFRLVGEDGGELARGEERFLHAPGEREEWRTVFALPQVDEAQHLTLQLHLFHADVLVHTLTKDYTIYPQALKNAPLAAAGKRTALLGDEESLRALEGLLPDLICFDDPDSAVLDHVDFLIIGRNFDGRLADWQPRLKKFVERGGFLLVLEQNSFAPGELVLSGQRFYTAYPTDSDHPVFAGLSADEFRFWGADNIHESEDAFLVQNAFHKPVQGDLNILLECGKGDFGYGGMQWAALLEYAVGPGRVVLNQVDIIANFDARPQAVRLLRNLLAYGIHYRPERKQMVGLITTPESDAERFFDATGLTYERISDDFDRYPLLILDPNALDDEKAAQLKTYVSGGAKLLILPVEAQHQALLAGLLGEEVAIVSAETYQVKANPHPFTAGISPHDLFHIERASYALITQENTIVCENAITAGRGEWLWENVKNPWEAYFIDGHSEEYRKVAMATMIEEAAFERRCYGLVVDIGQGTVILTQIRPLAGNDKIKRVYARLLSNLGAEIHTQLLSYLKDEKDYGIESVMALPHLAHQDYARMEAYFTDPDFILNNLGEGVFGWMKPLQKRDGCITVPDSAGQTWFLTLFIESELNRDPSQRASGVLPDPSIVPDMEVSGNSSFKLFINGRCQAEYENPEGALVDLHLEDTVLSQGINRVMFICRAKNDDIKLNARFKNKFGDYLTDLKYQLTLD